MGMDRVAGVAALVRCALFLDVQLDIEILGIGRSGLDRKDSCTMETVGKHLAYWIILDGGFIFLRAQEVDSCKLPEQLFSIGDTADGWRTLCQVIRALERNKVRSLQRPIEAGSGPNGFVIDY
jgi:hypothetical protein